MQCPSCRQDNPEGMKFCGECGTPFKHRCPQCGFDNLPRFKFCGECGTPLTRQSGVKTSLNRTTRHSYTQAASCEISSCAISIKRSAWTAAVTSGVS